MNSNKEESEKKHWNPFEVLLKMRRETPQFRRCCLCLPLRRGLISWGYIKLVLDVAAIAILIYVLTLVRMFLTLMVIQLVSLHVDAIFNMLLIVGGHLKNVKILKIAYYHSMVWLALMFILFFWYIYYELRMALGRISTGYYDVRYVLFISVSGLCVQFAIIFVQIYLVLLIRSEVLKLEKQNLEMQFSNPLSAEAQCTMHVVSDGDGPSGGHDELLI